MLRVVKNFTKLFKAL